LLVWLLVADAAFAVSVFVLSADVPVLFAPHPVNNAMLNIIYIIIAVILFVLIYPAPFSLVMFIV